MGKYIKLFETHTAYNDYITGQNVILPNVSYCDDNNDVHYNPYVPPSRVITAIFNINDIQNPTIMCLSFEGNNPWGYFENILVTRPNGTTFELTYEDLVEYDPYGGNDAYMCYQFDTIGNHIIQYTLKPNHNAIYADTFTFCERLTNITIPNCVTKLYSHALECSTNLVSVIIEATVPPTEVDDTTIDGSNELKIYVPAESVNAYKTASGWSYYASKIQAIPTT